MDARFWIRKIWAVPPMVFASGLALDIYTFVKVGFFFPFFGLVYGSFFFVITLMWALFIPREA